MVALNPGVPARFVTATHQQLPAARNPAAWLLHQVAEQKLIATAADGGWVTLGPRMALAHCTAASTGGGGVAAALFGCQHRAVACHLPCPCVPSYVVHVLHRCYRFCRCRRRRHRNRRYILRRKGSDRVVISHYTRSSKSWKCHHLLLTLKAGRWMCVMLQITKPPACGNLVPGSRFAGLPPHPPRLAVALA